MIICRTAATVHCDLLTTDNPFYVKGFGVESCVIFQFQRQAVQLHGLLPTSCSSVALNCCKYSRSNAASSVVADDTKSIIEAGLIV